MNRSQGVKIRTLAAADILKNLAGRLGPQAKVALKINPRTVKVVEALERALVRHRRLTRFTQNLGWVFLFLSEYIPIGWLTDRTKSEDWNVVDRDMRVRRWIFREIAMRYVGPADLEWMLTFPMCTTLSLETLTAR